MPIEKPKMSPNTPIPDSLLHRIQQAIERAVEGIPLNPEIAQAEYQTAMDLCEALGTHDHLLTDLEEQNDLVVLEWVIELPLALAFVGLVEEGATLAKQFAAITEADNFLPDRAILLAEAGRREEALAQVAENETRFPDHPWVTIKNGDVYECLGDLDQAERSYRQGLELAGEDSYTRAGAIERLIPLLNQLGRNEEADALINAETAADLERHERVTETLQQKTRSTTPTVPLDPLLDSDEDLENVEFPPLPYHRETPKVGRNDPCPCGSGKKYKKCCLGKF